jgi:hypothetical protein
VRIGCFSSAARNDGVLTYGAASYVADSNLVTRWRNFKSGYNAVNLRSWCRTVAPVRTIVARFDACDQGLAQS